MRRRVAGMAPPPEVCWMMAGLQPGLALGTRCIPTPPASWNQPLHPMGPLAGAGVLGAAQEREAHRRLPAQEHFPAPIPNKDMSKDKNKGKASYQLREKVH
eukprot:8114469-Heterocapsa_arctica.AAC.1